MSDYDLVIRNGMVATAADTTVCDIGIKDGVIATIGKDLAAGHGRSMQVESWYCRAASIATAISSSVPRPGSSAPMISTALLSRRRSAARRR